LLLFFVSCYYAVIIIYAADAVEEKYIKFLAVAPSKQPQSGQNIEINFQHNQKQPQPPIIEENKVNNDPIELKATKGGYNMVVENSKFEKANELN
jgi:hypothetical protein